MPEDVITEVRLSVMQNLLPITLALAERARDKGAQGVLEIFKKSDKPFQELRSEGEPSAQFMRDQLDKVSPGLGNPVVQVNVEVNNDQTIHTEINDIEELMIVLNNIDKRIYSLDKIISK